jgi:hypothetical protein
MSLWIPHLSSIIPPDGDLDGGSVADRAVLHPSLLWVPRLIDSLPDLQPGIAGLYDAPPPAVVTAMYARRWKINASLSGAGPTLTVTDEVVDPISAETWTEAIEDGTGMTFFDQVGFSEDPEFLSNWVQLSVVVASGNLWWSWEDGLWWPGLTVFAQTRDFEAEGNQFSTAQVGGSSGGAVSTSPVVLTFCGVSIPLPYTDSGGPGLSGSITIEPEDWLEVE